MSELLSLLAAVGGLARVYVTHGVLRDAAAIAASLFLIVLSSVLLGAALPFALARAGLDPAHAGSSIQVCVCCVSWPKREIRRDGMSSHIFNGTCVQRKKCSAFRKILGTVSIMCVCCAAFDRKRKKQNRNEKFCRRPYNYKQVATGASGSGYIMYTCVLFPAKS